jgi:hypothetical protein
MHYVACDRAMIHGVWTSSIGAVVLRGEEQPVLGQGKMMLEGDGPSGKVVLINA